MPRFVCCLLLIASTSLATAQDRSSVRRTQPSRSAEEAREVYLEAMRGRDSRSKPPAQAVAGQPVSLSVFIVALEGDVELREGQGYDLDEFQGLLKEWKQASHVIHTEQYRVSTLENIPATVQVGRSIAVPSGQSNGFTRGRDGQPVRQTQYQQRETGTIIAATVRIDSDSSVIVQIQVEQSLLEMPEPKGEDELTLPQINTLQTSTTARVPNGKLIRIGGSQSTADGKIVTQLVMLHAQHDAKPQAVMDAVETDDEVETTDAAEKPAEDKAE